MSVRPPLRVGVTRHDEKEQKLKDFIRAHLQVASRDASKANTVLMAVARSVESPIVKALLGLHQEIAASGTPLRLILAQLELDSLPDGWQDHVGALRCEVRWARRPRLIEAHEQLVLGPETCWIGDCMRRDPAKCDAFENFIEGCGEAAGCATVSFERLWVASEPISPLSQPSVALIADAANRPDGVEVGTRH